MPTLPFPVDEVDEPPATRPVLEEVVYAILREGVPSEQADKAFERLRQHLHRCPGSEQVFVLLLKRFDRLRRWWRDCVFPARSWRYPFRCRIASWMAIHIFSRPSPEMIPRTAPFAA